MKSFSSRPNLIDFELARLDSAPGGAPAPKTPPRLQRFSVGVSTGAPAARIQLSTYLTQPCIWDLLCADMKIRTAAIYPTISLSAGGKWPSRDH
jgi:hypothetical protein